MTRPEAVFLAALWIGLMATYWLTMPPDISFEDTPTFAGACATLGLAHQPGYPLHTLYCAPFAKALEALSFPAARGASLASAFDAATGATILAWLMARLTGSLAAAVLAAGLWGLSPTLLNQAQVPEVYALNAGLVVVTLACAHVYMRGGSRRWLLALLFVTGQGLANHWPLFMLAYPAVLLWLAPVRRRVWADALSPGFAWLALLSLAAGLSPYLHLVFVSPDAYLFDKDYTPGDFFPYVARQAYQDYTGAALPPFRHAVAVGCAALSFVVEFRFLFGLFVVAGLLVLAWSRKWWALLAVLWGMLSSTALLAAVRPFEPASELSWQWFAPYMTQAHAFAAIPLAVALAASFARLRMGPVVAKLACVSVIATVAATSWDGMDRSDEDIALPAARLVVDSVPADGILLLSDDDYFNFPIDYALYFSDKPAPAVDGVARHLEGRDNDAAEAALAALDRPVHYSVALDLATVGERFHGLHFSLDPEGAPGSTSIEVSDRARSLLAHMAKLQQGGVRDVFTRYFIERSLVTYAVEALKARLAGAALTRGDDSLLDALLGMPVGRYAAFIVAAEQAQGDAGDIDRAFEGLLPELSLLSPPRHSHASLLMANVMLGRGDADGARRLLEDALNRWPSNENAAVITRLLALLDAQGDHESYQQVRRSYLGLGASPWLDAADGRCEAAIGASCRQ